MISEVVVLGISTKPSGHLCLQVLYFIYVLRLKQIAAGMFREKHSLKLNKLNFYIIFYK